ncbi:TPA: insulinase family protein, partial [Candidatus Scatousia excrementigallinarum]|nr:insulinase family protein [Candidatus Scatousia excrementigallinarum]
INGNVDKDKTIKAFSTMFKSTDKEKFAFTPHIPDIKPLTEAKESIKEAPDTNTDWIFLGWQTAGMNNKKDFATLQVIDSLLGTGMSSRLFKNLRDQEGLAYQLGSSYSANALKGAFMVYIGTNPQTLEKSKNMLMAEINKLKTEFVGTKELEEAKDKLIGQFILSQETNLDKAATVGWFETIGAGYNFTDDYEKLINSVTESDIIEVANKYFTNNYVLSIVKK